MPETRVILVRHGETVWNLEGRYQGQLDSPLTGLGRRQAEAIARRLRDIPFDHLYASDLGRAMATAAAVGRTAVADPRLRERHFGIFHGLKKDILAESHPEVYAAYRAGDPDYAIPEGESLRQLHERARACLEELADRHAGQRLVLVSHGGTMGALVKHVLGLPVGARRPFRLANASYNLIVRNHGRWLLHTLGDICHLRGLGSADDIV